MPTPPMPETATVVPYFTDFVHRKRLLPAATRAIAKHLTEEHAEDTVTLNVITKSGTNNTFECTEDPDSTYTFLALRQHVEAQPLHRKLALVYSSPVW